MIIIAYLLIGLLISLILLRKDMLCESYDEPLKYILILMVLWVVVMPIFLVALLININQE